VSPRAPNQIKKTFAQARQRRPGLPAFDGRCAPAAVTWDEGGVGTDSFFVVILPKSAPVNK
jgi:hypothetical protein